ncbi:hypothetical protein [Streptomyces sp. SGAir0957]
MANLAMPNPSAAHVMSAPIPQLLAELNVEMVQTPIDDPRFYGAVFELKDGSRILAMPTGRDEFEHDYTARDLLARAFGATDEERTA